MNPVDAQNATEMKQNPRNPGHRRGPLPTLVSPWLFCSFQCIYRCKHYLRLKCYCVLWLGSRRTTDFHRVCVSGTWLLWPNYFILGFEKIIRKVHWTGILWINSETNSRKINRLRFWNRQWILSKSLLSVYACATNGYTSIYNFWWNVQCVAYLRKIYLTSTFFGLMWWYSR